MKSTSRTLALVWLTIFTLAVIVASCFSQAIETHVLNRALHLGFDAFGRNCLLLSLAAASESLKIILPIGFVSLAAALLLSFVGANENRRLKLIWDTGMDTFSSLPGFLIALAMSVFLKDQFSTVLLASVFLILPWLTRFFESQIIHLKSREFIRNSEALGGTGTHIFRQHLFPELLDSIVSIFPFLFTRLLLIETSLAWLGLTHASQNESWGQLLLQGKDYLLEAPWICVICGLPLFLTLLSFHLLSRSDPS